MMGKCGKHNKGKKTFRKLGKQASETERLENLEL